MIFQLLLSVILTTAPLKALFDFLTIFIANKTENLRGGGLGGDRVSPSLKGKFGVLDTPAGVSAARVEDL